MSGRDLICAYVAGFEAGVRVGQSAPGHHAGGWHLTGTLGSIAAGAAAARLLGLDAQRMTHALGIAATQASRHAAEPRHHVQVVPRRQGGVERPAGGAAGAAGLRQFPTRSSRASAASAASTATRQRLSWCSTQLGTRWEIARNGHKPYACGVVLHPALDAMIALAASVRSRRTRSSVSSCACIRSRCASPGSPIPRPGCSRSSASITRPRSPISTAMPASRSSPIERAAASDVVALRGKIEVAHRRVASARIRRRRR